jgi:hypothetical protein
MILLKFSMYLPCRVPWYSMFQISCPFSVAWSWSWSWSLHPSPCSRVTFPAIPCPKVRSSCPVPWTGALSLTVMYWVA